MIVPTMKPVPIRERGRVVNPAPGGMRLLALLSAYLDASSGGKGPAIMSVAGYVAPAWEWEYLEADWQKSLNFWRIPCFHMTALNDQLGVEKAELCKLHFERIIKQYMLYPFGAALPVADWHEPDWGSLPTVRLPSPYEQCLYFAFDALGRLLATHFPDEDAAIISCVDGPPSNIENVFRLIHPKFPRIVSATIGSPRIIPLQCADLGAGRLREKWRAIRTGQAEDQWWGDMPRNRRVRAGLSFWSLDIKDVAERGERLRKEEIRRMNEGGWSIMNLRDS